MEEFKIEVGISYDSDPEKAKEIIIKSALEHPRCLQYPAPDCFLTEFGDNSVNILIYFWVSDVAQGRFGPKSDVMMKILQRFKENDIEIPFPQRDVFIKNHNGSKKGI